MNTTVLTLPERPAKPRETGLTMVIDGGLPLGQFLPLSEVASRLAQVDHWPCPERLVKGNSRRATCLSSTGRPSR